MGDDAEMSQSEEEKEKQDEGKCEPWKLRSQKLLVENNSRAEEEDATHRERPKEGFNEVGR